MALLSWRVRRKTQYLTGVFLFFLVTLGIPLYFYFKVEPTCFDRKANGDERGVDCGGSCSLVCTSDVRPISVVWERTFFVSPGFATAAAYLENPNFNLIAPRVPFRFQIFDEKNVLISEKQGETFINTDGVFAMFEGPFNIGERKPDHVVFSFGTDVPWYRRSESVLLEVKRQELVATTSPRIEADIYNAGVLPLENVEVIAIAYDAGDNALGVSRTFIAMLAPLGTETATFSWPNPFSGEVARILILPRAAI